MKRILLASTAVAGLAALASPVSAAEPIQVSLGGTFEFYSGWIDTEAVGRPSNEFRIDPEVVIRSRGVTDNGLTYGIKFELETATGNPYSSATSGGGRNLRTDEAGGFISGSFGTVEFGDDDGAADRLAVFPTGVGFGQVDGDYNNFLLDFTRISTGGTEINYHKVVDTSDATKVSYFSPVFMGVQAGVSYAAGVGDEGDSVLAASSTYNSAVEAGINYKGEFSGVGLQASLTGVHMNGSGVPDLNAWGVGGRVSYAGFSLGGTYSDQDGVRLSAAAAAAGATPVASGGQAVNAGGGALRGTGSASPVEVSQTWTVGAAYEQGPVGVSLQYANADTNQLGDAGFESWFLGASYTLAPGLVLATDVVIYDNDAIQYGTKDDQGYLVMVGTILSF